MDWHSRYVLSWRLSNTLEADSCVDALEEALSRDLPGVFNTDQGSQFTSEAFTSVLVAHGVRISMDSVGSYMDNVFVERLWRSVKYEEVYLKAYESVAEARDGIGAYLSVCRQNKWDKRGAFKACNLDANRLRQFSDLPTSVRLDSFASPPVSSPVWRLAVHGTYPPA